jgi:hypothetical protein
MTEPTKRYEFSHKGVRWTVRRDTGERNSASQQGISTPAEQSGLHFDSEEDHYFLRLRRDDLPNDDRLQAMRRAELRALLRRARRSHSRWD